MPEIITLDSYDEYSLIADPRVDGEGSLWQSGNINERIYQLPAPLFVVQMIREHCDHKAVHNEFKTIIGVLALGMDDAPDTILPNNEYLAAVETVIGYLRSGFNVLIHCGMGISRSSYLILGVLIRHWHMPYDQAIAHLQIRRPVAAPNAGFAEHVRSLEGQLAQNIDALHIPLSCASE